LKQLGFFLIFILKSQSRDFFGIFEKGVRSLEIDFVVKLTRNKQFC
jgi:hypothetical protein